MGQILNRSDLASALGVAVTTVDAWIREGLPYVSRPEKKGQSGWQIDLAAVLNWHRERERANALGDIAKIDEGEAKRRKLAAEAAMAEHDLAMKQRAAVSIEDAAAAWDSSVGRFRARMLGLGNRMGPLVAMEMDPLECQSVIDGAVHEALRELSELEPDVPGAVNDDDSGTAEISESPAGLSGPLATAAAHAQGDSPAAAADGKRVGRGKSKAERGIVR